MVATAMCSEHQGKNIKRYRNVDHDSFFSNLITNMQMHLKLIPPSRTKTGLKKVHVLQYCWVHSSKHTQQRHEPKLLFNGCFQVRSCRNSELGNKLRLWVSSGTVASERESLSGGEWKTVIFSRINSLHFQPLTVEHLCPETARRKWVWGCRSACDGEKEQFSS